MAVSRRTVVQSFLSLFENPRYLEIGVNRGDPFHGVKAAHKVAVDPKFLFDTAPLQSSSVGYHQMPRDDYFGAIASLADRFDVIYLDGLHTAEQTFRDLLNAIQFLTPDGVSVIDDVRPSSSLAAVPNHEEYRALRRALHIDDKSWMGYVFRVIYLADSFLQQFTTRVVENNHGQAVLWRQRRRNVPERTLQAAADKSFHDLVLESPFVTRPLAEIVRFGSALSEWQADFEIHTVLELDGLAHGIQQLGTGEVSQALPLAQSSTFSKVAKQPPIEGDAPASDCRPASPLGFSKLASARCFAS